MDEHVILVDPDDRPVGTSEKLRAHRMGLLHRAFSIFVFGPDGSLLLQRRARSKYHSAGLWSNTCCGHPRPGETLRAAALRRLHEEMGFRCGLEEKGSFRYWARVTGGLVEHEIDHILVGFADVTPLPDVAEVAEWRWISSDVLARELRQPASTYTCWFPDAWRVASASLGRGAARIQ
jgi:isopentenyl-diphosphate delta-isomerase